MTVIGCVQVRMGSTRLPGKAFADVNGRPVLEWIIRRLRRCQSLEEVSVTTSAQAKDQPIVEFCQELNVPCHRGPEEDLIRRFLGPIRGSEADAIVRVTGDCPFVDPGLVDAMVEEFEATEPRPDVLTNIHPPSFPDGLDVEILTQDLLERLDATVEDPRLREWFTMHLYDTQGRFNVVNHASDRPIEGLRWTLDYPEDLELTRRIYAVFEGQETEFRMDDVLSVLAKDPTILEINEEHVDLPQDGIRSQAYFELMEEP